VVLALAFGESLAFVSLLLPATALLAAAGGLLGSAGIPFWPIWAAAAIIAPGTLLSRLLLH
jgi:membrane protein DedA with SNARE-associated domain